MKALRFSLQSNRLVPTRQLPPRTRLRALFPRRAMSAPSSTAPTLSPSTAGTSQPRQPKTKSKRQANTAAPASSSSPSSTQQPAVSYDYSSLHLTDIGANLIDDMYTGLYHSTRKHQPDLPAVLARSAQHGLSSLIVTAGTYDECRQACELIRTHQPLVPQCRLYTTCGIHPTRTKQFACLPAGQLQQLFDSMAEFIASPDSGGLVVAIGECGYDIDRLHFSSLADQHIVFPYHIRLAQLTGLPLFLHDRGATGELLPLLVGASPAVSGVVHSYTGGREGMLEYVRHGFYIGVNGCSLKTEAGLATVAAVPAERLLLETDAPWCDIKASHAGYRHVKSRWTEVKPERAGDGSAVVKGRNEPCKLLCVAEVVAAVRGVSVEELALVVAENTERLFGLSKVRQQGLTMQASAVPATDAVG